MNCDKKEPGESAGLFFFLNSCSSGHRDGSLEPNSDVERINALSKAADVERMKHLFDEKFA